MTNRTASPAAAKFQNLAFDLTIAAIDAATIVYPSVTIGPIRELRSLGIAELDAIALVDTAYKSIMIPTDPTDW